MQNTTTWKGEIRVPLALLAIGLGLGSIALEAAFDIPLRLPGHRAFPGAFALLLFVEAVPPLALAAIAVAVPLVLAALGLEPLTTLGVWIGALAVALLLSRTDFRRSLWFYLIVGLTFGALRVAMLWVGFHHTPQPVRLAGHLAFGVLAAAMAWGLSRAANQVIERKRRDLES